MDFLADIDPQRALLATATLVGAFGGFPEPPMFFKQLTQNELFRWFLVFVLVYQGGSGQNIKLAAMLTVAAFAVVKMLKTYKMGKQEEAKSEGFRRY
jgi:hypothetical protein